MSLGSSMVIGMSGSEELEMEEQDKLVSGFIPVGFIFLSVVLLNFRSLIVKNFVFE